MEENFLTASQLADRYGVKHVTARAWLKRGIVPGAELVETPVGSYWKIKELALKNFNPPNMGRPPKEKTSSKKTTKAKKSSK